MAAAEFDLNPSWLQRVSMSEPGTEPQAHSQESIAAQRHQCPVCFKHYKRREHLIRHAVSHRPDRPHRCESCGSAFQRADILKRHLRACEGDGTKPGAKKRACARCARQKKACGGERPCQGCSKKGLPCLDSGAEEFPVDEEQLRPSVNENMGEVGPVHEQALLPASIPPSFSAEEQIFDEFQMDHTGTLFLDSPFEWLNPHWQDDLLMAPESQVLRENPLIDTGQNKSLQFLDRFTSQTGLISSFDCCTLEQREEISTLLTLSLPVQDQEAMAHLPSAEYYQPKTLGDNSNDVTAQENMSADWLSDSLSLKTHEILLLVEEVVKIKPRNSSVTLSWSSGLKDCCLRFFSPSNLRRLLGLYWAIWYPNINLIHRPTFDPISAKPALIAAMALTGIYGILSSAE